MTSRAPNLVLAAGRSAGVDAFRAALAAHPEVGFVAAEDFDGVRGDADAFPPWSYAPVERADDFAAIASRLAGQHRYVGWCPGRFIEMVHCLWTTLANLPHARYVFCLRNPTDAVHARYRARQATIGMSLEEAVDACEREMAAIGAWSSRGTWDRFLENPSEVSLLLQGSAYYPALSRCLRFVTREQVHVVRYEEFARAPEETLPALWAFLGLDAPPDAPDLPVQDGAEPMPAALRARLDDYFAELNRALFDLLGWPADVWR